MTDDGVLFSLEKIVEKGSGSSMVIWRLVDGKWIHANTQYDVDHKFVMISPSESHITFWNRNRRSFGAQ